MTTQKLTAPTTTTRNEEEHQELRRSCRAYQTALGNIAARFSHDGGHRAEKKGMTQTSSPAEWEQFFEELYVEQAHEADSKLHETPAERTRLLGYVSLLEYREHLMRAALEVRMLDDNPGYNKNKLKPEDSVDKLELGIRAIRTIKDLTAKTRAQVCYNCGKVLDTAGQCDECGHHG